MQILIKKSTRNLVSKRHGIALVVAALFSSYSLSSLAYDFEGVLKQTIEEKIGKQIEPQAETADSGSTAAAKQINWNSPSQDEEIAIGREITGNLLGAAPLLKDAALQKYVNAVGRWVAAQSGRAELPWRFGVIDSDDVNAFAAPGGYVVVTKGLYRKLTNEAQLAGVLGHEIGHIVKKHQLKVLQKQQLLNVGAGFLTEKFAKNNQLASKAIGSGAEISARSLDKDAEFEADRLGVTYATRAGYEPFALAEVLQTLSQTKDSDDSVALLFKTHPHPDARLTALDAAIGSKLDRIQTGKTLENRFYTLEN